MSEDPKLFDAGDYNLFRYCHNDPIDLTDPMGLDGVSNGDGTYRFEIRREIIIPSIIGGHVVNSKGNALQCAGAAQFLTGTRTTDGTLHDGPPAKNHGWTQGAPLTKQTPIGTMVARGWKDGFYPNENPKQAAENGSKVLNHTGVLMGWDKNNQAIVLDQNASRDGSLQMNSYDPKEGDWSVVNAKLRYDPNPSTSDLRLREQEKGTEEAKTRASNIIHSKKDEDQP